MSRSLEDKVAVVTGASSGIGAATAIALANARAKVVLAARRVARLEDLRDEIADQGGESIAVECDVTRRSDCAALASSALEQWRRIDILVNNAGVMPLSFVKRLRLGEWERMVDVNIKGVMFSTAAVLPHFFERQAGHVVNVSSIAGRRVFPSGSVYCATKFAVNAFSEGLRLELSARSGIRVTAIQPGVVDTELTAAITDPSLDDMKTWMRSIDVLQPEDIADAIVFAVTAPAHVNVNEIVVRPTQQEQ